MEIIVDLFAGGGGASAGICMALGRDPDVAINHDPVATATTKDRFGLITVMVKGEPYIITDIGMRMLSPRELFRAQGFSDSYQIDIDIDGKHITKTDQVRCCGNSVCPPIAQALVASNVSNQELVAAAAQP